MALPATHLFMWRVNGLGKFISIFYPSKMEIGMVLIQCESIILYTLVLGFGAF